MKDMRHCQRSCRAQCYTFCIGAEKKKEIPHHLPLVAEENTEQTCLSVRTYQPAYQLESTVFFSHNKTASAGFNTSRIGPKIRGIVSTSGKTCMGQ